MGGLSECPAPAVFETTFVFDEAVEVLDLQASAVALFRGCANLWERGLRSLVKG